MVDVRLKDSVLSKVSKLLDIDILGDRIICRDSFFLHAIGGVLQSIEWSSDSLFSNIIKRSDYDLSGVVKDKVTLYVRARSNSNCPGSDSITIFNQKVETVPFKDDYRFCEQDTFEITLRNINPNHNNTYSWSPSQLVIEGQGTGTIKSKIPNFVMIKYLPSMLPINLIVLQLIQLMWILLVSLK